MHFSAACVARALTVTEPITPASVLWVVAARVCDATVAWVHVAPRVRSHTLPKTLLTIHFSKLVVVGAVMNFGLFDG